MSTQGCPSVTGKPAIGNGVHTLQVVGDGKACVCIRVGELPELVRVGDNEGILILRQGVGDCSVGHRCAAVTYTVLQVYCLNLKRSLKPKILRHGFLVQYSM